MSGPTPPPVPVAARALSAAPDLSAELDELDRLTALVALLARQPLSADGADLVRGVERSARRLERQLGDRLALEQAASRSPAVEAVSLLVLAQEVETAWNAGASPILLLTADIPPDLIVSTDGGRFRRVLDGLIRAARCCAPDGMVEVRIAARDLRERSVGIDVRVRTACDEDGADPDARMAGGLLQLCEAALASLGGALERPVSPGRGWTAGFTLVLDRPACDDAVDEADGPLPAHTHLLIVDDNATNRMVAAALCETFGCSSESAENGVEAVEAASARRFDLILMDIRMPLMDGLEATRAIRALPGAAGETPIVALTANGDPEAIAAYIEAGMQGFVEKPIKPHELLSTLQAALAGAGPEPAMAETAAAA